uniref:Cir_N domain-containing protein n=1 Tax=Parastrongyloides trichosuri TaxID=131310 RepID=A0A0N4Z9X8_PARTI
MNILPKKNWHVLRRENIQKVRRDEKNAEETERRRLERIQKAEHEVKLQELRKQKIGHNSSPSTFLKHINLFEDKEIEGNEEKNEEYEKEKKDKINKFESRLGIKKMFAEGTNELDKKKSWYETSPTRFYEGNHEDGKKNWKDMIKERTDKDKEEFKKMLLDEIKIQKRKDKKKKHISRDEKNKKKEDTLKKLREERLNREKGEKRKINNLLGIKEELLCIEDTSKTKKSRPMYNSMYHPELARRH